MDPWLLGVLLGDGCNIYHPVITNPDTDILHNIENIVKEYGVDVHYRKTNHSKTCQEVSLCGCSKKNNERKKNIIIQKLKELDLWGKKSDKKFIPFIYKTGSIKTRLDVLAGLLDTDGHLNNGRNFDFISKSEELSQDVTFICRSLGLMASCHKEKKCCQNGYSNYYWRVCISGDLSIIPNKCSRKKHKLPRGQKKDVLKTGFTIKEVGEDDFYGFELSGDHLYMTNDFFIHHNSGKSILISSIAEKIGGNTLVLQPSKEILEQNYKKAVDYGFKNIGVFSASMGRKDIGRLTLATIGSIINKKELFREVDHLIIDESHLVSSKGGMYEEFISFFGGKVLGLTATPFRMRSYMETNSGEKRVVASFLTRTRPRIFTKIIYLTQIEDLYDQGFLCPIQYDHNYIYDQSSIKLNSTGMDFDSDDLEKYNKDIDLVGTVKDAIIKQNHKHILVFVSSVKEAYDLSSALDNSGISAATVSAKTPKNEREDILEAFKKGYIKVVTNCGTMTCGYDFPALDCVILARPTQSVSLYMQMCLDEKTEILTDTGWKGYGDISYKDRIASVNIKGESPTVLFEYPQEIIIRDREHKEKMVSISNNFLDIRVTENHDMVMSSRKKIFWKKEVAIDSASRKDGYNLLMSAFEKTDGLPLRDCEIKFLGWFLTDSSINKKTMAVVISQSIAQPHFFEIEKMLKECGFKYGKYKANSKTSFNSNGDRYVFSVSKGMPRDKDKHLTGWSKLEAYIDKKIPSIYDGINSRQLDILLEAMHLGNGSKQLGQSWTRRSYHISFGNQEIVDRLQAICVRHGWRCNISRLVNNNGNYIYHLHAKKILFRHIGGYKQKDRDCLSIESNYKKEKVWCVKVNSGSFIARRNFKAFITGNCGRTIRIAPGKEYCKIIDVCGNVKRFGMIEMFKIVEVKPGLHRLKSNVGYLTGFDFVSNTDIEANSRKEILDLYKNRSIPDIISFGKFKGTHITKVPSFYLEWCVKNMNGAIVDKFKGELERRNRISINKEDKSIEDVLGKISSMDSVF